MSLYHVTDTIITDMMHQQNQQKEKAFPVVLCYQTENLRNSRNILCLATCLFDHNISGIKIDHGSATQSAVQKYHKAGREALN